MSQFVTANGVNTTLAAAITSTATAISLSSSANLPTLQTGQIIPLILRSASAVGVFEIVYGTAISGSSITVDRSMEGTSAQNFNVGDYVLCGPTAGSNALIMAVMNPVASETLPQAYGAIVIPGTLSAAITLGLLESPTVGTAYTVYGANEAVTVDTGVTSGAPGIIFPDGSTVYSWEIPAGATAQGIHIDFDGTNWRAQTFGQTVVAPATQSNEAVQLNQLFIGNRKAIFTFNGTFTVPDYVDTIWVSGCAGGGGGGGGNALSSAAQGSGGGGGFAGQQVLKTQISVAGGASLTIAIGSGGSSGAGAGVLLNAGNGSTGGDTVLSNGSNTLLSLIGGNGGGGAYVADSYVYSAPGFMVGLCVPGVDSSFNTGNGIVSHGGSGESSTFGNGGSGGTGNQNGGNGTYGGGGGGGGGGNGSGSNGNNGGTGGNGILIIEW